MSRRRCFSESAVAPGRRHDDEDEDRRREMVAPQTADLLSPAECAKVHFVMSLCELTRDTALVTLASHRWNLPKAVTAAFEAAHPAPLPAPGPERPGAVPQPTDDVFEIYDRPWQKGDPVPSGLADVPPPGGPPGAEGICQHCARTQGRRQEVCCARCPQSHTHTCDKRNQRRQSTGYVIVRAPLDRPEWLGLHRVSWAELKARTLAGGSPDSLGRGVVPRRVRTDREAQQYWTQAGNLGPMPRRG